METIQIDLKSAHYPLLLREHLGSDTPPCLYAMGDPGLLRHPLVGLICSVRCPGTVILKTFDAIRALRDQGVTVIGGFHSPMEFECLELLLRGTAPVILCPAKGLSGLRLGADARAALASGRLLALSPFAEDVRRTTSAQASQRNCLVAALSCAVLAPYASPDGKAWEAVAAALGRRQPVFTFPVAENANLLAAGARPFEKMATESLHYSQKST